MDAWSGSIKGSRSLYRPLSRPTSSSNKGRFGCAILPICSLYLRPLTSMPSWSLIICTTISMPCTPSVPSPRCCTSLFSISTPRVKATGLAYSTIMRSGGWLRRTTASKVTFVTPNVGCCEPQAKRDKQSGFCIALGPGNFWTLRYQKLKSWRYCAEFQRRTCLRKDSVSINIDSGFASRYDT